MNIFNFLIIYIVIASATQQTEISNSSNILKDIFIAVTDLIYDLGHLGIFVAALVETLFPIIPSELIFPLAGYVAQDQNLGLEYAITMALAGSLGSTLGAIIIYYISLKLGRKVLLRIGKYVLINEKKLERAEIWFEKHGQLAVFLGRLAPGIRELISIPAGLSKMNIIYFTFFYIYWIFHMEFKFNSCWFLSRRCVEYICRRIFRCFQRCCNIHNGYNWNYINF